MHTVCNVLTYGTREQNTVLRNDGEESPIVLQRQFVKRFSVDEDSAFRFMTNDAQDLEMGVGNTYIAIMTPESPVAWETASEIG